MSKETSKEKAQDLPAALPEPLLTDSSPQNASSKQMDNTNGTSVIKEENLNQDEQRQKTGSISKPRLSDALKSGTSREREVTSDMEQPTQISADIFHWKENFYEKVEARSVAMQEKVRNKVFQQKDLDKRMAEKVPFDNLAGEWLEDKKMSMETQAYLLEKLLPTLMPGVEKMLMEVEKRKLLDSKPTKTFDPINYLGEYLMRNNPDFQKDLPETGYLKAMKDVANDMKTQIPDTPLNRVFKMKNAVKEKRERRENVDKIKSQVGKMRKDALGLQFKEWLLDADGKIPLPVIQNAVRVFMETSPENKMGSLYYPMETIGSMKEKVDEEHFISDIFPSIKNLASDTFMEFLKHLCHCADDFWEIVKHDRWRQKFLNLFLACDVGKMGFLDRERTLSLLENFYDKSPKMVKKLFRNPRYWPFVEFGEVELAEFWGDLDDENCPYEGMEQPSVLELKKPFITFAKQLPQFEAYQTEKQKSEQKVISWSTTTVTYNDNSVLHETVNEEEETIPDKRSSLEQLQEKMGSMEKLTSESLPETKGSQEAKQGEPSGEQDRPVESSSSKVSVREQRSTTEEKRNSRSEVRKDSSGTPKKSISSIGQRSSVAEMQEPQEPQEEKGEQSNISQEPSKISPKPSKISQEPAKMSQEPSKTSQEPAKTSREPSKTSQEPAKTSREPSKVFKEPSKISQEPSKISQEPSKISQEPSKISQEPSKISREPSKISQEPSKISQEPLKLSQSGKTYQGPSASAVDLEKPSTDRKPLVSEKKEASTLKENVLFQRESSKNLLVSFPEEEDAEMQIKDAKSITEQPHPENGEKDLASDSRKQLIDGKPWTGELLTSELSKMYKKYGENQQPYLVSNDPRFLELRAIINSIKAQEPSKIRSAFTANYLTLPQFVQLLETFVGDGIPAGIMKKFITFFKKNYVETEEEKINHLEKIQQETIQKRRKLLLEALFQKWDNEGSGFLDLEEVDKVLFTYKEGMEKASMMKAKMHIRLPRYYPDQDVKLNVEDFGNYIQLVVSELTGNEDEVLDNIVEFLMMSLCKTHAEQLRRVARRKWLLHIQKAAETSGVCLEPVYTAVFKALTQDSEAHGNNKKISANIAILEENKTEPERGEIILRNVACTTEDSSFVLEQVLYQDMKGVSFTVVTQGRPIHVPQVEKHGNIHFWNTSRQPKDNRGSLLVLPLEDAQKRVFGVLRVDTLRDNFRKNIFLTHEISFYQGVANAFSIAYHYVHSREHILHVILTATSWLRIVAPSIKNITTYLVEPGPNQDSDYVLRKMMYMNNKGNVEIFSSPSILHRKENLFREHIFKSTDTSQVVFTYALGTYHIAAPIRDRRGQALGSLDFSTGQRKMLTNQEYKDLQKMLKIVQAACHEILGEYLGEIKKKYKLEMEYEGEVQRTGILFFRIMLNEVQGRIVELNPQAFRDLRSYYDQYLYTLHETPSFEKSPDKPSELVHDIIKAILLIVYPEKKEIIDDWDACRQHITNELISKLCSFDPTAESVKVEPDLIIKYVRGNSRRSVWIHSSVAIEYLYHWALTCLCLIEMKIKLKGKYIPPLPPGKLTRYRFQMIM